MKSSPSKLRNLGNAEMLGPLSSRAVICSARESLAVAACCAVADCRVETVDVRFEISVEFCANSCPCCDSIATIAGSSVVGCGLYTCGVLTDELWGAPDNSDNGGGGGGGGGRGVGGGGMTEGLVEEEKRSIEYSN